MDSPTIFERCRLKSRITSSDGHALLQQQALITPRLPLVVDTRFGPVIGSASTDVHSFDARKTSTVRLEDPVQDEPQG